jgi:uncharacterized membrane protein
MALLVLGLVLFFAVHSVAIVAPGARERAVQALGRNGWRGIYSLISVAGFVLLVVGYGQARQAPVLLYAPPPWLRHVTFLLMLPVFPLVFAAYLPGKIKAKLKHPMLAAVKTWAVAHLLANGMLADVLLFGGFLAWAVLDRVSLKRRVQQPMVAVPASRWNDLIAVVLGLVAYAMFVTFLHRLLIGVPVMGALR